MPTRTEVTIPLYGGLSFSINTRREVAAFQITATVGFPPWLQKRLGDQATIADIRTRTNSLIRDIEKVHELMGNLAEPDFVAWCEIAAGIRREDLNLTITRLDGTKTVLRLTSVKGLMPDCTWFGVVRILGTRLRNRISEWTQPKK